MFQSLVVLGIIPGTNIQINFELWLFGVIAGLITWYVKTHKEQVTMWLWICRIRLAIATHMLEVK